MTASRPIPTATARTAARTKPRATTAKQKRAGTTPPVLFTIGYEKALPAAVIGELKRAGVKLLIDVRAVAASRRPGFSKKQLAAGLDEAGIAYLHLQPLGTPAEGRTAARAGRIETLFRIYDAHLAGKPAQAALDDVIDIIRTGQRAALLCYCRDPNACHRSRIAAQLKARLGLEVRDLIPPLF